MVKTKLAALLAASVVLVGAAAAAEEASRSEPGNDPPSLAVVNGLRPDDLLNVRATASATGIVLGRLPNGSAVRTYGCGQFNGYKWCKVEALDVQGLNGWSPGRYLRAPTPDEAPEMEAKSAAAAPSAPAVETPAAALVAAPASALPAPAPFADAPAAATSSRNAGQDDAAPVLGARFGQTTGETTADAEASPETLSARLGETDGAKPTVANVDNPVTGEIYSLGLKPEEASAEPETPTEAMPPPLPASTDAAPSPAPRPEPAPSPAIDTQVVAQLQPSAPAVDAVGEIPCARYVGQPMTRCATEIVRSGPDAADVTVDWPDGGKRVIRFRGGKPEGANSRGEFRYTREGDLNMIRIGLAERFEIPDALPFGD